MPCPAADTPSVPGISGGSGLRQTFRDLFRFKTRPRASSTSTAFLIVVLSGMVALLAIVATLQYRWTSEASNAEEMRIGAELESLLLKWHADLYGEFSAICTAIQVGPDSGARDTWNDYLDRYVEWNYALPHQSAPYVYRNPDLVGEVYIWETSRQANPRFFLLDLDKRRIEPSDIPRNLSALLVRLRANSADLSTALRAWQLQPQATGSAIDSESSVAAAPPASNSATGWQFDPEIPAIFHPILHHEPGKPLTSSGPVDWIVITIDMGVLQKRTLPQLASRYFGGLNGLEYKLALVKTGSSPATIYSSDSEFGIEQMDSADSTMSIFTPQLKEMSRNVRLPSIANYVPGIAGRRNLTGFVWFPVVQYGQASDSWVLEVQHRSGPLQAAIGGLRRKNLVVSAAVLLLLAINIGILTVAGYRAQVFARMQTDFVASVSHELRTPVSAIFSVGENLRDGVVRTSSDMVAYGSLITAQSRRLMNHVDHILLFASIRSGKDRYTLSALQIPEIFDHVRKAVSPLLDDKSCIFEERVQPGLPPVLGDLYAVCGCLENLITNAVKYSPENSRIVMATALEETEGGRQEVTISIHDHGMGIYASELKSIFEPFNRGSNARKEQIQGTGLGLSLAKHLAEAMGGRLTVTSEIGVGSTFTLHLRPARAEEHQSNIAFGSFQVES